MKRMINVLVGILATIVFLGGGLWIIYWGIGQILLVQASLTWPTTPGTVILSQIKRVGDSREPEIVYRYTVNALEYTAGQIRFDIFNDPGGQGRTETLINRYPVGQTVSVFFNPDQPGMAVLERGDYSPFLMPLFQRRVSDPLWFLPEASWISLQPRLTGLRLRRRVIRWSVIVPSVLSD